MTQRKQYEDEVIIWRLNPDSAVYQIFRRCFIEEKRLENHKTISNQRN